MAAGPPPQPSTDAATAAERGWFGLARELWSQAAARDGRTDRQPAPADGLARLEAARRQADTGADARDAAAGNRWSAGDWPQRWQERHDDERCEAAGVDGLTVAGGLVIWTTDRGIHAIDLATGGQPWLAADPTGRDTTLFPRGVAARGPPAAAPPQPVSAPPVCAGRCYATLVADGNRRLLVCLDLSAAAEGRLAWVVDAATLRTSAPEGVGAALRFDGQPTVDHDLCLVVMQSDSPRLGLLLAAFDTRDGSLRWLRPAGPAITPGGLDLARGRRQACLAEDRIVLATHAGSVRAFDRAGNAVWTTDVPAAAAATDDLRPAIFARDRLLLASSDPPGVVALEPRQGRIAWQWTAAADASVDVLGVSGDGVVIGTRSPDGTAVLRRLTLADGRETARTDPTSMPLHAAGRAAVADATVFWPVRSRPAGPAAAAEDANQGDGLLVEVLDATTLVRRRPPLAVPSLPPRAAACGGTVGVAVAAGSLVLAGPGLMTCWQPARSADESTAENR